MPKMADLPTSVSHTPWSKPEKKKKKPIEKPENRERAKRGERLDQVYELIKDKPMSAPEIAAVIKVEITEAHGILARLKKMGRAAKTAQRPARWYRVKQVEYSGLRGVVRMKEGK